MADMMTIREKLGTRKEKGAADVGVASETAADGGAEQFCSGVGTVRPRPADRASDGYDARRRTDDEIEQQAADKRRQC